MAWMAHHAVEPWFRRMPGRAVAGGVALIAAIGVLGFTVDGAAEVAGLLFVLPIALLALAFGLRAGLFAGVGCIAVLTAWVLTVDGDVTAVAWTTRAAPLVLLGVLVGHAADLQRTANRVATRLAVAHARQRDAAEVNDTIVQHLSAAKWMFERGATEEGIGEVEGAIVAGQGLVSDLLAELDDPRRARARAGTNAHHVPTP